MIRVAIAEDHAEMRSALRLLMGLSKNMKLICEPSDGQEAVDCMKSLQPDVLVMDIRMPVLDGLATTRLIRKLGFKTPIVLISSYRGGYIVTKAREAGAQGFVPKDDIAKNLPPAIEAVYRGETYFIE